ncbi:hypothetical protein C8Q73DRAFT_805577 [Cubamyces lactineus]|nr:hypothetical protein C8Q73DRAFT_805577 [Cubamyces lactineus]
MVKMLSGFCVCMRTVFVPYFLLPQETNGVQTRKVRQVKSPCADSGSASDSDSDLDNDILHEQEQREAGNEEHTVVLSVEIENVFAELHVSSFSPTFHFEVSSLTSCRGRTGSRCALPHFDVRSAADFAHCGEAQMRIAARPGFAKLRYRGSTQMSMAAGKFKISDNYM